MSVRVLLVDDEVDFAETLAERLETRGFTVSTAHNGEDALAKLRDTIFDVVVLDVIMPGLGGMDALREIKRLCPLVEVIMLTGHATVETAIEGMKCGAFDYLKKPTETSDLVAKISAAGQRRNEQEERIRQAEIHEIVGRKGW